VWQQVVATGVELAGTLAVTLGTLVHPGFGLQWALSAQDGTADAWTWVGLVLVAGMTVGSTVLWLIGLPLGALWHQRTARRLLAMGRPLRYPPLAHGGWWFVPVAQLVMPYRATSELVTVALGSGTSLLERLPSWWAAWLGWLLMRWAIPSELTMDDLVWLVGVTALMQSLRLWATWVYVRIVREVSAVVVPP
jgi:hypothetical protein